MKVIAYAIFSAPIRLCIEFMLLKLLREPSQRLNYS